MEGAVQVEKHILVPLRIRSLLATIWQQTLSLASRLASLSGKIEISHPSARRTNDIIPPFGIVIGAIAFGFWLSSFAAGLFAGFALFFLAGIYKATGRMVSALTAGECNGMARTNADRDVFAGADQSHRNVETLAAIHDLRAWVANETSPTEENVKASCAVLLESIVPRHDK